MNQAPDFESIKHINIQGQAYWRARELMPLLGYGKKWQNFHEVIKRAIVSCEENGLVARSHFVQAEQTVQQGRATRTITDYFLSKRACHLIAMNADPHKAEIAAAQNYFSFATEAYELHQLQEQQEQRLQLRMKVSEENKELSSTAKFSGVKGQNMGLFHDAGYLGLYHMTSTELAQFWQLPEGTEVLNVMDVEGLAANLFRITQTNAKLQRDHVADEDQAILTHHDVGQEIRGTLQRLHQKKPENLPRAADLRHQLEEKRRQQRKRQQKQKQIDDSGQGTLF